MWDFLAVNFKCPMKPAFSILRGSHCAKFDFFYNPHCFTISFSASLLKSRRTSGPSLYGFKSRHSSFMCLQFVLWTRLWNINQLLCFSLVAFILGGSDNLNTGSFGFLQGTKKHQFCERSADVTYGFVISLFHCLIYYSWYYWQCIKYYKNQHLVYRVVICL